MAWQLKPKTVWPTAASKSKCAAPGATPSQRRARRPGNQAKQQPCFWGPRPRVWCPCSGVRRSRRHAFRKVRQWGRLHGFGCARQRRRGRGIWSGAADFKWLSLPRATPRPANQNTETHALIACCRLRCAHKTHVLGTQKGTCAPKDSKAANRNVCKILHAAEGFHFRTSDTCEE